jgi:hypothetical protein
MPPGLLRLDDKRRGKNGSEASNKGATVHSIT